MSRTDDTAEIFRLQHLDPDEQLRRSFYGMVRSTSTLLCTVSTDYFLNQRQ